jgi:hypothetical protein
MKWKVLPTLLLGLIVGGMACTGCSMSGDEVMDIGSQYIETSTYAEVTDSVTLRFSTIHADSLQTSATGVALVGSYLQSALGKVHASAYFNFAYDDGEPDRKEVFDSLTMVLNYSGYCLGDTMKPMTIHVYRLTDSIKSDNSLFYNINTIEHEPKPIGSYTFLPQPKSGGFIEFSLNKVFASEMWTFINTKNESETNQFEKFFRGVVLKSDESANEAVVGFLVSDTMSYMKLYSHITADEKTTITRKIASENTTKQFNHFGLDAENELLEQMNDKSMIGETLTNGMSFMQAGTGYRTRIDIPNVDKLIELKELGRIVKAVLYLKPALGTYDVNQLPSDLVLTQVNKVNEVTAYFTDSNKNLLNGNLVTDAVFNEETYYSYDVTSYVNTLMSNYMTTPGVGLALTFPEDEYDQSVNALVFGGFTHAQSKSYIKIFYYNYDQEKR